MSNYMCSTLKVFSGGVIKEGNLQQVLSVLSFKVFISFCHTSQNLKAFKSF